MSILRSDLKKVVAGIKRIEKDMEMLKLDYGSGARTIQTVHLGNITRHTQELEYHLNMTIMDCAMAGRQYWKEYNLPAMDGLHWAFVSMNHVFRHLKRMEGRSRRGRPRIAVFNALDSDWEKFKRAIFRTINITGQPLKRRKHYPSCPENEGNRRRAWGVMP